MSVYPEGVEVFKEAHVSDDGRYRYLLTRWWDGTLPLLPFIMLNPSTADATEDDPTIRRCVSFSQTVGEYGGIVVYNLYAYRATKPQDMWAAAKEGIDIVGPENDDYLQNIFLSRTVGGGGIVVAAWGINAKPDRVEQVLSYPGATQVLHHLGLTAKGHPRHPLMLRETAVLTPWSPDVPTQPESTPPIDPWSGHSHPIDGTACPSDCPKKPDSGVDNPAPDSESSQVSEPDQVDTLTDSDGDEVVVHPVKVITGNGKTTVDPIVEKVKTATKKAAVKRGKNRQSGNPAATEEAEKQADDATEPQDAPLDVERMEWFESPGFRRMRTAWEGEDKIQMDRVQGVISRMVFEAFTDAYAVMSDIYDLVREPEVDEVSGEVRLDANGFVVWKKNPLTLAYYEDWSQLTLRAREDFLFRITTSLFEWEQRAADMHTRAMFSKGMFVERFAIEYDAPIHGTIDDRNARGNKEAAEDRYFALMNSAASRKADALVRTMTNLMLRLKDTLGQ